jgi:hypothetical protein
MRDNFKALFASIKRPPQFFKEYTRGWIGIDEIRAYERLWNFLNSDVVVLSGATQLNILTDQYSLWKTARSIATGLTIIVIETLVIPVVNINILDQTNIYRSIWMLVIYVVAFSLGYYITLGTYSRLCFILFSLVYVTNGKLIKAVDTTEGS